MRIKNQEFEIIDEIDGQAILKKLEKIARVCYKSEDRIKKGSAEKLLKSIIDRGHEAMLEHYSISVVFNTNRAIANEIVRHRLCSFAQESTRYCNYSKDKFDNQITVIKPYGLEDNTPEFNLWNGQTITDERTYFDLLNHGMKPEIARDVLPLDLATTIVVTANLREWRYIFDLRCDSHAHPQIRELMLPLLEEFHKKIPVIFDDLYEKYCK